MDSADFMVLRRLYEWRKADRKAMLVTVVQTWGSSPRPVGSMMAMLDDGTVVGSVSGGCIEDDLIYQHTRNPWPATPQILTYGVDADEARRFGLPCGGTMKLVAEFNPKPGLLAELLDSITQGRLVSRTLNMHNGQVQQAPIDSARPLSYSDASMTSVFGPSYRMLIIGAGQLSEYLATMAIFNGFSVTVCDPRTEYSSVWSVDGVQVLAGMPDDVVDEFAPDARTCIIALTHDPKLDDLALLSALHSDAFYVGAIGSRRNTAARRERMIEYLDQTPEIMDKLRGPVGIFIGSKTPAEISVSIMAEVIAVKNGVELPRQYDITSEKERLTGAAATGTAS